MLERDPEVAAFILPTTLQQHRVQFERDDIVYLSIECDGESCGYFILALEADGSSVEFRRIVVATRGRGIGQRAIPLMEAWCRDRLGRGSFGGRRSGCSFARGRHRGYGDEWLGHLPVQCEWYCRFQADGRPGRAGLYRADFILAGHSRPDDQIGQRRCDDDECHGDR